MIYSIVIEAVPKSYNSEKKKRYMDFIVSEFKKKYPNFIPIDEDLYGIIYYFRKKNNGHDADNISKPVWDALKETAYTDDKLIKIRKSGIVDIKPNFNQNEIDITNVPANDLDKMITAFENTDHFLYIEFSSLKTSMFSFQWGDEND